MRRVVAHHTATDPTPGDGAFVSEEPDLDDPPPLLGTWTNLYALVLGALVFQIVLYSLLSRVLS